MHIAIDARALSHPQPGGFKSYTTNLIRSLLDIDDTNRYTILLDRPIADDVLPVAPNAKIEIHDGERGMWGMPFREQVRLPLRLRRGVFDLFHAPCATGPLDPGLPSVITIHDAIEFLEVGQSRIRLTTEGVKRILMPKYSRMVQRYIARRAARIITVSSHSRDDLTRVLGIEESLIRVIPIAHSPIFKIRSAAEVDVYRHRMNLPPEFLLSMVSSSPRKNTDGLLRIYARLPESLRARFPLVMLWTHASLLPEIEALVAKLELSHFVRYLHQITDDELVLLYNAASVFVFPSLYEGFGLPVLEAMACGIPVVASNLTSVPELTGEAAQLADPTDEDVFEAALRHVLECPERRVNLRDAGLCRAGEFSWHRTARMTLDVYQEAFERFKPARDY